MDQFCHQMTNKTQMEIEEARFYYQIQDQDVRSIVINSPTNPLISLTKLSLFLHQSHFLQEIPEIVFKGIVRGCKDKIPYSETSPKEPVHFYSRRLKVPSNKTPEDFFTGRGMSLKMILETAELQKYIEKAQNRDFKFNPRNIQGTYVKSCKDNNAWKKVLIGMFLREAYNVEEGDRLIVDEEQALMKTFFDEVTADHVVMNMRNDRIFIVSENFSDDIYEATIKNLDQLIAYNHRHCNNGDLLFKYNYGVATTGFQWRFVCYVKPEDGRPVNQNNFLVSEIFNLEIENGIPTVRSIENLIFTMRTFIIGNDMDQVLEKG